MVSAPHLMTYCETVDFLGIHDQSFFSLGNGAARVCV